LVKGKGLVVAADSAVDASAVESRSVGAENPVGSCLWAMKPIAAEVCTGRSEPLPGPFPAIHRRHALAAAAAVSSREETVHEQRHCSGVFSSSRTRCPR